MSELAVAKYDFAEPRDNLPHKQKGVDTAEDRFTIAFCKAYLEQANRIHARSRKTERCLVREIPVNGYGITDLLAIAWEPLPNERFNSVEAFIKVAKPTCRAFEMKLSNWRKAMQQASRYKNFAHQTIAVLPPRECEKALQYIETFRCISVGLWSFDIATSSIHCFFTSRPKMPSSMHRVAEAVSKAGLVL